MPTYTFPDLPYDYGALRPAIIGEIVQLHLADAADTTPEVVLDRLSTVHSRPDG